MHSSERHLIQKLFDRLAAAENQRRDPDVEGLIASEMQRVPHAPYAMAQTIIAQNQALEAAASRIAELESGRMRKDGIAPGAMGAPDLGRGGSIPSVRSGAASGGFLANAGQIALGVAGGTMLGEAAKALLGSGSEAQAAPIAESGANDAGDQAGASDLGADVAGAGEEERGGLFDWLFGGGDAANDHDMADGGWDWDGGE